MPEAGQPAPDFNLPQDAGDAISLAALKGAPVVLFFYPKADTSGCTKEAVAFTGLLEAFGAAGVKVFGISKDPATKLAKFRAKHDLGVGLLSDAEGSVCEDYGVWVEKSMYGKKYMGIERSTFLIGADGTLSEVWRKVKVPGHAEAVLDAVKAL
ncbi:MAG: thioredoxin-dependent thiol peroxidase [Pseudomonadota bacterium]